MSFSRQNCHACAHGGLAVALEWSPAGWPIPKTAPSLSELPLLLPLVSRKRKCLSDRLAVLVLIHSMMSFILNMTSLKYSFHTINCRDLKSTIWWVFTNLYTSGCTTTVPSGFLVPLCTELILPPSLRQLLITSCFSEFHISGCHTICVLHSLLLSRIPFNVYTTVYLFSHLSMGIWVNTSFVSTILNRARLDFYRLC